MVAHVCAGDERGKEKGSWMEEEGDRGRGGEGRGGEGGETCNLADREFSEVGTWIAWTRSSREVSFPNSSLA